MKTPAKLIIVASLVALIAVAVALKERGSSESSPASGHSDPFAAAAAPAKNSDPTATTATAITTARLPRLVDLGAEKCIPCKMMAPILADLQRDYASHFTTEFIDVWKNPEAGKSYGVEMIPTQIFYDAEGEERFRHVGFLGKEDILNQWKQLGVHVSPDPN